MIVKAMLNRANLVKLVNYSLILGSLFIIFGIVPRFNQPVTPKVYAACRDVLTDCSCLGGNLVCSHQLSDCSTSAEIHNEMPGAPVCKQNSDAVSTESTPPMPAVSASPGSTPASSSAPITEGGIGGGPGSSPGPSATPAVVASQTDNNGELPRTGPFDTLILLALIGIGVKLVAFRSKFVDSNPHLTWVGRQLKKQ
jgi:hypothetical protein